jgi:hypothetical protein
MIFAFGDKLEVVIFINLIQNTIRACACFVYEHAFVNKKIKLQLITGN